MESESQTRKRRIDASLEAAGWKIVPFGDGLGIGGLRCHAVEEYPTANGPTDYALVAGGQMLGIVEAKKLTVGARGALTQAERYSKGVADSPFNFDGYAATNELDYPFSIFVSLALLKPVTPFFSSGYAEIVMNSDVIFTQARERVSGIGTPDLHLVEIRDFRTPLPPLSEQHEIVRRVEKLFAFADQIGARLEQAQAHVDRLTQSLLAKAFRGELVPTEAELARREERSHESASELLERIRAAKADEAPAKRKRGTARKAREA
ncbi:MAG: hypothetical protein FJ276_02725 [Planctomycetes bacterium]|nr:hypothetical protein [Planctomycetota bacterium]